jgi:hypothetical protein
VGVIFRASQTSWKLLVALTEIVPQSNAARLLISGKILLSVRKSLDEWLETHSSKSSQQIQQAALSTKSGSKRGIKRKRDAEKVIVHESKHISEAQSSEVYDFIAMFIEQLIAKTETFHKDTDLIAQEHLKSALRVDPELAAEVLSSWMRVCRIQVAGNSKLGLLSLDPFMKVWSFRSVASETGDQASSESFSNYCVVPLALLYGTILKSPPGRNNTSQDLKQEAEELFSRYLFLPSRAAYFSARQQRSAAIGLGISTLVTLLTPLQEAISYCQTSNNSDQLDLLLSTIPSLYELAIQNTRHSTPKQRHLETPWLEAVLCALSTVGGASISQLLVNQPVQGITDAPDSSYPPLVSMLKISKDHKIALNEDLLRVIVSQFTGLRVSSAGGLGIANKIHWSLILAIIDFDGSIFVGNSERNSDPNPNLTAPDFSRRLISQISRMTWEYLPKDPDNRSSTIDQNRDQFVSTVLIGLMNAYINLRRLPDFIKLWNSELTNISASIAGPNEGQTVWTSELLMKEAETKWESTIIPTQLSSLLGEFTLKLDGLTKEIQSATGNSEGAVDVAEFTSYSEAAAALVVLDALLAAISRDEFFSATRDSMQQLFSSVNSLIESKIQLFKLEPRIFRILSRILQRQVYCETAEDLVRQLKDILLSKAMEMAKQKISPIEALSSDSYEALVFILTACDISLRDTSLKDDTEGLAKAAAIYVESQWTMIRTSNNVNDLSPANLIDITIAFPFILQDLSKEDRFATLKAALSWQSDLTLRHQHEELQTSITCSNYIKKLLALQESIIILASHRILWEWVMTILSFFSPQSITLIMEDRLAKLFMTLPPKVLTKQQKISIADKLVDYSINLTKRSPGEQLVGLLARIVRLAGKSKVSTDADTLFKLALLRPIDKDVSVSFCQSFIDIVAYVFETLENDENVSHRTGYLANYDRLLNEMIKGDFQVMRESGCYFDIPLIVYRLWSASNRSKHAIKLDQEVHRVFQDHLQTFCKDKMLKGRVTAQPSIRLSLDLVQDYFDEIEGPEDGTNSSPERHQGISPTIFGLLSHTGFDTESKDSPVPFDRAVTLVESYFETTSISIERKAKVLTLLRRWAHLFVKQNPQWIGALIESSKPEGISRAYLICRNLCIEELDRDYLIDGEKASQVKAILPLLAKELQNPISTEAYEIGYTITIMLTILRSKVSSPLLPCISLGNAYNDE